MVAFSYFRIAKVGGISVIKRSADLQPVTHHNRFGGAGEVSLKALLAGDEFGGKGRVFSHIVVFPESSIGFHQHQGDFETYYILKGEGQVKDNGVKTAVKAGDVIYTRDGESHGLTNTGGSNLELIALVLYS